MGGDGGGFVPAEHHSGGAAGQLGSMGTSSIAHPRAPQHPRGGGVAVAAATTPGRAGRTLRRRHAAGRWGGRGWWLACWIVRWVDPLLGRAASQAALPLGLTLALHLRPQKHRAAHPQNSRFTPRCPSVVLWTPCSGVEWGVFEPTIMVWRSGNDAQAACEPGGGGCGGVTVHPARLHTHRTSPAQALSTIFD
jgi:hypothetical protein